MIDKKLDFLSLLKVIMLQKMCQIKVDIERTYICKFHVLLFKTEPTVAFKRSYVLATTEVLFLLLKQTPMTY